MTAVTERDQIMFSKQIVVAALIVGASSAAQAYDTGKLTCQNVGQLAAQMVAARQSGVSPDAYLSALNEKLPPDAQIERKLVFDLAKVVYENDQIAVMQPEQVYGVFAQNCLDGQEQDRMSGERDENSDEDENEMDEDDSAQQ
jgi:hypothetical protein